MTLLLDTHVLLWWLNDAPNVPASVRAELLDPRNSIFVSAVTALEIEIKRALGKLDISKDWAQAVFVDAFFELPVTWQHALAVGRLPDMHRDPFDRLLVAQAMVERLTLVTADAKIAQYGIPVLWG